jgi:hypothetical protein
MAVENNSPALLTQMILRRSGRALFLPGIVYADEVESPPPLPPVPIDHIPALASHPVKPTYLWQSWRDTEAKATPEEVLLGPDANLAQMLAEIEAAPDMDDPSDPDFVPADVTPANQRLPAIGDPRDLHLDHLLPEQLMLVQQWFAQAGPGTSYHEQVRDIAAALRSYEPKASFDVIGRIFGITRGAVYKHLKDCGWSDNQGKALCYWTGRVAETQRVLDGAFSGKRSGDVRRCVGFP